MMETLAERKRFFIGSAARAGEFWLGYVQQHQQNPPALDAERDNILQAIAASQVYGAVWQLAATLALQFHGYMMYTGQWKLWEHWLRRLLKARGEQTSPVIEARLQSGLAKTLGRQGRWSEAVRREERSVALFREAGEPSDLARGLVDLANGYFNLERWTETLTLTQEAWSVAGPEGDGGVLADIWILRGRICLQRGQPDQALEHFQSAWQVADEPRRKATANFMGIAHLRQGQPEEALPHLWQALGLARREGDRPGQGVILANIGYAYLQMEQPDQALAHLGRSLAITRETDNRLAQAIVLLRLGQVHLGRGNRAQARRHLDQALEMARAVGNAVWEAQIQEAIRLAHR